MDVVYHTVRVKNYCKHYPPFPVKEKKSTRVIDEPFAFYDGTPYMK